MKFEERRTMSRGELAALLKRLSEKIQQGVLDYTRGEVAIPDRLDVEIEYKEKDSERKFELELRWAGGGTAVAAKPASIETEKTVMEATKSKKAETEACEQLPPDMDGLKSELKKIFKAIQSGLESGKFPAMGDIVKMRELNVKFNEYSRNKGWSEEARAFTAKMAEFEATVEKGDLASAQKLIEELRIAKKECHRDHRWTE